MLGDPKTHAVIVPVLKKLFGQVMAGSEHVVIHCAAGIHRTGTMAYTLLRMSGYSAEESLEQLKVMREDTHRGVGDHRIEIAEKQLLPKVLAA